MKTLLLALTLSAAFMGCRSNEVIEATSNTNADYRDVKVGDDSGRLAALCESLWGTVVRGLSVLWLRVWIRRQSRWDTGGA